MGMTPVTIEYCPYPWIRYKKKILTSHPTGWHELNPGQLIAAVRVMQSSITDDQLIASMLSLKLRLVKRLSLFQKYCIVDLLTFLETYNPYYEFILPGIGPFKAPLPRLKDETFGTFIFAETYFEKYVTTSDKEYLAKFIACYYREGPFLEKDINLNASRIAKYSTVDQEAIFINYILIRSWLEEQYSNVFAPAEDQTKKEKSSWIDVYDAIVGDDIVQQEQYANLPISTVLRYLDKRIKTQRHEGKIP